MMIATDVVVFVHGMSYCPQYLCEKRAKYHILFIKFQFTDQIANKNVWHFFKDFTLSKAISIKYYFRNELLPLITNFWLEKNTKICPFLANKGSQT